MEEMSVGSYRKTKKRRGYFRYIQRNIEFYMSDANLRRDSYLRKELNANLEVDLSLFLKFNRIQALGADIVDLRTALKPSRVLKLVGDSKLKRISPIVEKTKEDIDRCTIYVERLPPDTTPESLAKIFSPFGKVCMVSIPKYNSNKKVKGYGFVEFESESSCTFALQKFASYGGLVWNQQGDSCRKCAGLISEHNTEKECAVGVEPGTDVPFMSLCTPLSSMSTITITPDPTPARTRTPERNMILASGSSNIDLLSEVPEKRKRNRKKKKWQRKKNCFAYIGFQVMAKVTWNQLRKRYLSLQAANRRSMKLQLKKLKRPSIRPKKIRALVPGTVVSISSAKSVTESEAKSLKTHLRQVNSVEYVDIECGQQTGYVRLSTPEAAHTLARHATEILPNYKVDILPSAAEDLYWIKIEHDRLIKLKSDKTKKGIGGGKKILMKAEKHLGVKIRLSPDTG